MFIMYFYYGFIYAIISFDKENSNCEGVRKLLVLYVHSQIQYHRM